MEPAAYDAIYAFTAGIPRRINLVCNRLMLAGFLGEMHVLTAGDVETVVSEIKEELGVVGKDAAAKQRDESQSAETGLEPETGEDVAAANGRAGQGGQAVAKHQGVRYRYRTQAGATGKDARARTQPDAAR